LILGTKPTTIVTTKPITYSLTVKDLTGLALSVSGSIRVPNLTTTSLSIKISGSGMITANGTANDQYLEISGSGRYLTDRPTSETMKARICGSGTASVAAMDVLDVKISGSGTLTYRGNFFDLRATYAEGPKHGARIFPVRITLPDGEVVS
jgi:Putative auto-transporter adhesin, head GIN domain